MEKEFISRLESLLRQAQFLLPDSSSSDEFAGVYGNICQLILYQENIQSLWHEPILLQLDWLFNSKSPNQEVFGQCIGQLKERKLKVCLINNCFFSILDNSSSAEDVFKALSAICTTDQSLLPRLAVWGHLESIRKCEEAPSAKISLLLEALKDDLGLNLLEHESVKKSLDSLKQREGPGRVNALLVKSGRNSALVVPLDLKLQPGDGQIHCAVQAEGAFDIAIRRAQMALQDGAYFPRMLDVVYCMELTDFEYTGSSIGLAAAAAMFAASRRIVIDPYTAFTGDVKLEQGEWKVKSVIGLSQKLAAARLSGCRRIFVPKEDMRELQPSEQEEFGVIGIENVGEILLHLQSAPRPLTEDSLQAKKINILQTHCRATGWSLSEPRIIQSGVQFCVAPLNLPVLTMTFYDSGTHVPKEHAQIEYKPLITDLSDIEQKAIPVSSRQKTYTIQERSLQEEIKACFEDIKPDGKRNEQHCQYVFEFKRGQERLIVKQYNSGKLQIQGSGGELFKTILECIIPRYKLHHPTASLSVEGELRTEEGARSGGTTPAASSTNLQPIPLPYIGTDESGKGDYFGSMVIAGVLVDETTKPKLEVLGVKDSKLLSDKRCRELATQVRSICGVRCEVVELPPERYNQRYEEFKKEKQNLNHLLAWGHARAIESLLQRQPCSHAVADQFGDEKYILSRLMQKGRNLNLRQLTKGERYIAVAAASILARDKFLERMDKLSQEYGITLPKGASDAVVAVGREIVGKKGTEELCKVAKLHHKTTEKILNRSGGVDHG